MINKKNLKIKINSIKYVYKITKSMEMISISKYRYLYKKFIVNNYYLNYIYNILNNVFINNKRFFFIQNKKNIDNIFYLVVSTDQGLCGNLNTNLFNELVKNIKKNFFFKKNIYLILLGKKSYLLIDILKKKKIKFILLKYYYINKILNNLNNKITKKIIFFYKKNVNTKIFIVSNILNNKKIIWNIDQLLPIKLNKNINRVNYLYENSKNIIIDEILFNYINNKIFNFILNNMVSEYSSRILVMKNASINSENLFKKLDLTYNKLRQFIITREIIELVSSLNKI